MESFSKSYGNTSKAPHAIEVYYGKNRLLGSCGTIFEKSQDWKKSLLSAAAHSMLIIEKTDPDFKGSIVKESSSKRFKNFLFFLKMISP